jgi:hypothetical protein
LETKLQFGSEVSGPFQALVVHPSGSISIEYFGKPVQIMACAGAGMGDGVKELVESLQKG